MRCLSGALLDNGWTVWNVAGVRSTKNAVGDVPVAGAHQGTTSFSVRGAGWSVQVDLDGDARLDLLVTALSNSSSATHLCAFHGSADASSFGEGAMSPSPPP